MHCNDETEFIDCTEAHVKVLLATVGSRGDVQPLAVLGEALLRAGHEVILAASPDGAPIARAHGVPFLECGRDVTRWLATIEVEKLSPLRVLAEFRAFLAAELQVQTPILLEAARGASVIVSAGLQALGKTVAEVHGARSLFTYYAPSLVVSREHPPMFIANQGLPGIVNRGLHSFSNLFFNRVLLPYLNIERSRLSLPRLHSFFQALPRDLLFAWDPAVAALPADALAIARQLGLDVRIHHTGALLPQPHPLHDDVIRFLDSGAGHSSPCVYVGFGSMPDQAPEQTRALVVAAAKRAGVRAILHAPVLARAAAQDRERDGVLLIEGASHASLFPRVQAIVHHCGSGTTATASRAGVPQVAVPHFVDQPLWAERLRRRGVCAAVIPRTALDARSLAGALRRCLDDTALLERARALRATLALTDPVPAAVRVIEGLAGDGGTGHVDDSA